MTRVIVEGDGDVDVHLLLGTDQSPAGSSVPACVSSPARPRSAVAADTGHRGGPGLDGGAAEISPPKDMLGTVAALLRDQKQAQPARQPRPVRTSTLEHLGIAPAAG